MNPIYFEVTKDNPRLEKGVYARFGYRVFRVRSIAHFNWLKSRYGNSQKWD